jgi:hypothetical protein
MVGLCDLCLPVLCIFLAAVILPLQVAALSFRVYVLHPLIQGTIDRGPAFGPGLKGKKASNSRLRWCDVLAARRRSAPRVKTYYFERLNSRWNQYKNFGYSYKPDEDIDPYSPPPPDPVIGGEGDCWRRLFPYYQSHGTRMLMSEFLQLCSEDYERQGHVFAARGLVMGLRIIFNRDGSFHLADTKFFSTAYRTPDEYARRKPPPLIPVGWYTMKTVRFLTPFVPLQGEQAVIGASASSTGLDFFYDTPHHATGASYSILSYMDSLRRARTETPFQVPANMRVFLNKAGLSDPDPFAPVRKHPVHVALERLNVRLISSLLKPNEWYSLFIKDGKVAEYDLPTPGDQYAPQLVGKDLLRYRDVNSKLRPPSSNLPVWFMHDALHYFSPSEIGSWFDHNPTLRHLVVTTVIPPELLDGLAPRHPALYDFQINGSTFAYVPEGDVGGAYPDAPLSCVSWLTASTLVTPRRECVHVTLLNTQYAHHAFVISRQQFVNQSIRYYDIGAVTAVPWAAAPAWNPADRVVDLNLYNDLCDYAMRVNATSISDLYNKIAGYKAMYNEHFSASDKAIAVQGAMYHRCVRWNASPSTLTVVFLWFLSVFQLPLGGFSWFLQSLTLGMFRSPFGRRSYLKAKCRPLVSHVRDAFIIDTELCPKPFARPFYLPPDATPLEALAVLNASILTLAVSKVFLVEPLIRVWRYADDLGRFIRWLWWVLEWTPLRCFLFILGVCLADWFHLVPDEPFVAARLAFTHLTPVPYTLAEVFSSFISHVFMLPSRGWRIRGGGNWLWQLACFFEFTGAVLPRLWAWELKPHAYWGLFKYVVLHKYGDGSDASQATFHWMDYVCLVFYTLTFTYTILQLFLWCAFRVGISNDRLPYHRIPDTPVDPAPYDPEDFEVHSLPRPDLFIRSLRRAINDTVWHGKLYDRWAVMPQPPAAVRATPKKAGKRRAVQGPPASQASGSGVPGPVNQVQPVPPPPPVQPAVNQPPVVAPIANVFQPWTFFPGAFLGLAQFRNALESVPLNALPPILPDPAIMCVWDALAGVLGCDPFRLWAAYMATLNPVDQQAFQMGMVPLARVADVFNYFRVTSSVYRRDGLEYNPAFPPVLVTSPVDSWANLIGSIGMVNGLEHITLGLPDAGVNAGSPALLAGSWVGLLNIRVPFDFIAPLLNVPTKGWKLIADTMLGRVASASIAAAAPAGFVPNRFPGLRPPRVLPETYIQPDIINWVPNAADMDQAKLLASDFKIYYDQLPSAVNPYSTSRALDSLADYGWEDFAPSNGGPPRRSIELILLNGVAGSGKSHWVRNWLRGELAAGRINATNFKVHSQFQPLRATLMRDFKAIMPQLRGYNFPTADAVFTNACSGTLVLDDAGLLLPGTIPLLAAIHPGLERIICTFDSAQTKAVFPYANAMSRQVEPTVSWLSAKSTHYASVSRRLSVENATLFGLPPPRAAEGYAPTHGQIYTVTQPPDGIPFFVASPRYATVRNKGGTFCMEFELLQGMSFDGDIAIDCGGLTSSMTDSIMWTAITRTRGSIYLVLPKDVTNKDYLTEASYGTSMIISAILAVGSKENSPVISPRVDHDNLVARAVQAHLERALSRNASAGLGLAAPQPVVAGDGRYNVIPLGSTYAEIPVKTVLPDQVLSQNLHRELHNLRVKRERGRRPRGVRRKATAHGATEVHTYDYEPDSKRRAAFHDRLKPYFPVANDTVLTKSSDPMDVPPLPTINAAVDPTLYDFTTAAAERREVYSSAARLYTRQIDPNGSGIGLSHSRRDTATESISFDRRIHPQLAKPDLTPLQRKQYDALRRGFLKFIPLKQKRFNRYLFIECEREAIKSWAGGRTITELNRAMDNAQPDWHINHVDAFLKGQYVKKQPKWFKDAQPGQVILQGSPHGVFTDMVWASYIERSIFSIVPDHVYLHAGRTPMDQIAWYNKHWDRSKPITACDYTAWDTGRGLPFLYFDLWIMNQLGVKQSYRDEYARRKLESKCFRGPLPVMQFSGDRYTWLFNTLSNVALTGASQNCDSSTPAAFSGDDMILNGDFDFTVDAHLNWPMEPKLEKADYGEFCGMTFGRDDCHLSPKILLYRGMIALGRGERSADFWRSYIHAWRFVHATDEADDYAVAALGLYFTALNLFSLSSDPLAPPLSSLPKYFVQSIQPYT